MVNTWAVIKLSKPWKRPDFNSREVRRVVRRGGMDVQKTARRLVNRKGVVSSPGELPGRSTGILFRSIKNRMVSPWTTKVEAKRNPELMRKGTYGAKRDAYYPAFLLFGTPTMAARRDFFTEAMDAERPQIEQKLRDAVDKNLKWVPFR